MKVNVTKSIISSVLLKKILKILTYLIVAQLILITIVFVYFVIKKDDIGRDLLLRLNEIQNGNINFKKITLAPFEHFPDISLALDSVSYFENKEANKENTDYNIGNFGSIYLTFDLLDLLGGNYNVLTVTLQEGQIRIITYPDSSTNLGNAISAKDDSSSAEEIVFKEIDTLATKEELEKFLTVNNFTLKNVHLEFENRVVERKISLFIDNMSASYKHQAKQNDLKLSADFNLDLYRLKGITLLKNKHIQIGANLHYDGKRKFVSIESSNVYIERAKFNMTGSIDIAEDSDMNLEIELADKDFSLLSFVFNEVVIYQNHKNLLKGDLNLQAKIIGRASIEVPFIEINFGVQNVNLYLPKVGKSIKDLNLDGYITTGHKKDFSEAELKVKEFRAQLPEGETRGSLTLRNLKKPSVDLDWYLKTDLSGFNGVLKTNMIDSLAGTITIDIDTEGIIDLKHQRIIGDKYKMNLLFEDVSMKIPEVISLDKINGRIRRENLNLLFEDLCIVSNRSDLTINGIIKNILFLAFNIDSTVTADLNLTSDVFDLPEVFAFNPGDGYSFNHIFHDLELTFRANTSSNKLLNFDSSPAINFEIDSFNASFDDFPNIKLKNTYISFFDDTSGVHIQFDPLDIYTAKGEMTLSGAYNGSDWKPNSLVSKTKVKNLNMLNLMNQFGMDQDSTSFFNFILNGSFDINLEFPKDSLIFKTLKLTDADLTVYHMAYDDTVLTNSLKISLKDIYYDLEMNSNPMATLSTTGTIYAERIKVKSLDEEKVKFTISTNGGEYSIIPDSERFFRTRGDGLITARPWDDVPSYRIQYDVERFAMEDWLAKYMEDPVISGPMNFHLDVRMTGNNWDNPLKELKGTIQSEGTNLRFYGLNLDNVIAKVERSRHFTLLDIGAVVFAGPVGLAVTKGLDAVVLIAGNKGEVTVIPKLVSNWDINDGKLEANDVAFATEENRVAAKGYINVADDTLSITFAILNNDGSASLAQKIHGHLDKQEFGDIQIIESILAPVTNLFDFVLPFDDEIFYRGSVKHPE